MLAPSSWAYTSSNTNVQSTDSPICINSFLTILPLFAPRAALWTSFTHICTYTIPLLPVELQGPAYEVLTLADNLFCGFNSHTLVQITTVSFVLVGLRVYKTAHVFVAKGLAFLA